VTAKPWISGPRVLLSPFVTNFCLHISFKTAGTANKHLTCEKSVLTLIRMAKVENYLKCFKYEKIRKKYVFLL
jgi:hypothetical protein